MQIKSNTPNNTVQSEKLRTCIREARSSNLGRYPDNPYIFRDFYHPQVNRGIRACNRPQSIPPDPIKLTESDRLFISLDATVACSQPTAVHCTLSPATPTCRVVAISPRSTCTKSDHTEDISAQIL